ncbi:prephenate/arogenate dehydrogenase family protein [Thalassobaculum sp. OXR-137]|uniref:prephenate/arogenate dehydrogenase family protein n=1 Tax=Thalassobaculum sp. OXR-137 TaxID=3100173 RepID=UPI002AC8CAE2|nr:prephenate/arogenate dehydrogenase family protein [Thalassobaculum sp. OXR-137]WPZ35403.1 prephenate/arogenate dehydrogenase family protein [Thalassobaculum sp. OXR-137]
MTTPAPSGEPVFGTLAVIGIGNLGSSVARAVRKYGAVERVIAADLSSEALTRAEQLNLADAYYDAPSKAVAQADVVVLCTPLGAFGAIAKAMAPHLKPGAVVTDVGSVKGAVVAAAGPHMPASVAFVPGHPIAGTEKSGPDAGSSDLFVGRYWILTPDETTDRAAVAKVTELWTRCGAIVEEMKAEYHDKVLAVTSHLPHLIAYTIVGTAFDLEGQEQQDVIRFSAGGFRDFTRIAGSSPIMWRDIFLNNREAVLEMLQRFSEDLSYLQRAIRWGEGDKLQDLFTRTREVRRSVIEAKQDKPFPEGGNGK